MSIKVFVPDSLQNTGSEKTGFGKVIIPNLLVIKKWFPGLFFCLDEPWAKESYHR